MLTFIVTIEHVNGLLTKRYLVRAKDPDDAVEQAEDIVIKESCDGLRDRFDDMYRVRCIKAQHGSGGAHVFEPVPV